MKYVCNYCGERASTRDHVVPRRYSYTRKTVEACADCNNHLGALPLFTEEARRAYLAQTLETKLAGLQGPSWSPRELRELGPDLRTMIQAGLDQVKILERRVEFLKRPRI